MRALPATAALALAGGALLTGAVPAAAASTPPSTIRVGQLSVSAVAGALPVGAGITVISHCPTGTRLVAGATREAGEEHDGRLRVRSREYWRTAAVVRYRVAERLSASDPALVVTAALCEGRLPASATTYHAKATTDLRIWGPAPARLNLVNSTVSLVGDDSDEPFVYRTAVRAAGVDSHRASVRGAVKAIQAAVNRDGVGAVAASGQTQRRVKVGRFASMRSSYRFTADLRSRISVD